MKNLLLLWLLIYAITGTRAFAEKAMSPVLLAPTNFAKNISKDSIKFTWQNAQNEANAKVNAYRIVISENAQFNGYSQSTGRCNITCVTSVINSTTFTTGLRSSNKTYYWRVQGLSSSENGEWSRTGTFKTYVPVPSIINASATPSPVTQGSTLTIAATLSGILPSNYSVKFNDNGNLSAMNGSGTSYSLSQSSSVIGVKNYSVGVYDINSNLKSSLFNGTYEVKKPNAAPSLSFISGSTTATTGTSYTVQLQGNDTDNNLSSITINWGDGTSNSQNTANGSTLTFTHTYATANSYTWSATASDSVNASSDNLNRNVIVTKANTAPSLSFISGNATATTGTNYTVQLQGNDTDNNLSSITINWGDGTSNSQNTANGSTLTFTHTYATANSYTWSATASDSVNASSDNLSKNVTVSKANTAPSLSFISGNAIATTGTVYTVQLQGNDTDNNLSQITINWGDGTSNSQNTASGSTLTFTHTYATANSYTWSATASDSVNASSDNVAKTVTVSSPVLIPSISSASASPTSTTSGNSINFSATLSGNLPSGYTVKLSYGNTNVTMSGSGTNYSVVQTPTILGQQVFTVGIYDSNNTLKSNSFTGNFEIVKANAVPTLSFISGNTTATAGTGYSVQLQASDADNNLQSISVVWGDGTTDMRNAINGTTLTFTHTYVTANTYNWIATALDSGNASSSVIAKTVNVSAAVVTTPVSTSGYTKISNTGATLPDTAVLGSGSNDWACTKDNKTGLIWEVKTTDGGLRDMGKNYTNYFFNDLGYGDIKNTDGFVAAINAIKFCGATNWRLPNNEELKGLIYCSDGKYNVLGKDVVGRICANGDTNLIVTPTINSTYFPNTVPWLFWSSSPSSYNDRAWLTGFGSGASDYYFKNSTFNVRLVHNDAVANKTSKLNDTGITTCSNSTTNNLPCPVSDFPNQDAQSGRDATNNDDSDGHAGFSFTKINSTGASLPASATSWNCVKDNVTGLMWEVKTTDGGLHDQNHKYTWYEPDNTTNGGGAGTQNEGSCSGSQCDTNAYVKAVNSVGYCGYKDWRMPLIEELLSIVVLDRFSPAIDTDFFANTPSTLYWSSSANAVSKDYAWFIYDFGSTGGYPKSNAFSARLVRN